MTTTTSYSETGRFTSLWKGTIWRRKGEFALISVLMVIFYLLTYLMEALPVIASNMLERTALANDPYYYRDLYGFGMNYTGVSSALFPMLMIVVPILLALILQSYMHNKRASDVFHALPVRRETLLGANFAAAMTILWTPLVVCNLIISLVQMTKFGGNPVILGQLWLDTLGWMAASACIYTVTTFACVMVGTVFNAFVHTSALLLTIPTLCGLYLGLSSMFLWGYTPSEEFFRKIFLFSPASLMPMRMVLSEMSGGSSSGTFGGLDASTLMVLHENTIAIFVYLLVAAGILWAAMVAYRRRPSELAANATSSGPLSRTIQMIGTLTFGLFTGLFFYSLISYEESEWTFVIWTLVGAILTFVILEAIFNRGFKTLLRSLPIGALMVFLTVMAPVGLLTGGFGFESRLPAVDQVVSVEIDYTGRFGDQVTQMTVNDDGSYSTQTDKTLVLTDPKNLEAIHTYHQGAIAANKLTGDDDSIYGYYNLTYKLKNGSTMLRSYPRSTLEGVAALGQIDVSEEYLAQRHGAFFVTPDQIDRWTLTGPFSGEGTLLPSLTEDESKQLLTAMQNDLRAQTYDQLVSGEKLLGSLAFYTQYTQTVERGTAKGTFLLTSPTQETYRLLQQFGLLDQLEVDLSKCIAVIAQTESDGYNRTSGIRQVHPGNNTRDTNALAAEIAEVESSRQYYRDQMVEEGLTAVGMQAMYGDSMPAVFRDPQEIKLLADNVIASCGNSTPVVYARFYFSDASQASTVFIPLEKLPQQMREQFELQYYLK